MNVAYETIVDSPVGALRLRAEAGTLVALEFHRDGRGTTRAGDGVAFAEPLDEAIRQLQAYFAGRRRAFDLPIALSGTSFQLATWEALRTIPYGVTRSYSEIAVAIGRPTAVRAVGAANGKNPIAIVVPCHRVIGAGGELTGFGGGLEVKRRLLELEQALPQRSLLG